MALVPAMVVVVVSLSLASGTVLAKNRWRDKVHQKDNRERKIHGRLSSFRFMDEVIREKAQSLGYDRLLRTMHEEFIRVHTGLGLVVTTTQVAKADVSSELRIAVPLLLSKEKPARIIEALTEAEKNAVTRAIAANYGEYDVPLIEIFGDLAPSDGDEAF